MVTNREMRFVENQIENKIYEDKGENRWRRPKNNNK